VAAQFTDGLSREDSGIGYGKGRFLALEHGLAAVELMRQVKRAVDPEGIFNPGKIADATEGPMRA